MKYVRQTDIIAYLKDKNYSSISATGSIKGMKQLYGWNRAKEIIKSGSLYYAIWG